MPKNPPVEPQKHDDDEVLSFLDHLERMLRQLLVGIFVFFGKIPKWVRQVLQTLLEDIWEYVERIVRYLVKLAQVALVSASLITIVVGPLVLFYRYKVPFMWSVIWMLIMICAIIFSMRRYLRLKFEQIKRARSTGKTMPLICENCRTAARGTEPPAECPHCGVAWRGVRV